ncbi:putative 3-methyladenine DNA glycosylase [Pullulanibacillus camelliae]|uniref:Putative 3-methyladenine DNA glycosylase n=1 Tax=Pullulanibacillus camelliae TaxID=1707096 RepID=A0A8J2YKP0_9BACL|nr:DNA-3-methyladenine glycosylase [Pullulanibacillus camelliae]GGE48934.1 putative 3-methyladenine DNA glycosylase [Pullulanibacillus camelliae]
MDNAFYNQPTLALAKSLLGKHLIHETNQGPIAGRIVEVEAYMGPEDRAAHSYGGRRTKRTEVMFGPPGHAYFFLIYGMYQCFNVVSGPINKPEAILVRALEPVEGINVMIQHRFQKKYTEGLREEKLTLRLKKQLTNGPGKLTQALGINQRYYGHDLRLPPLHIIEPPATPLSNPPVIASGPRINIDYAKEAIHYPWRFWLENNPYISQ